MTAAYSLSFRPATPADEPFLAEVYRLIRWEELAATDWTAAQKRAFLHQQFEFQTKDWNRNYPGASREIVLVDREAAGRLYIDRRESKKDLRIVDIALNPPFRNRGIGTKIITDLFEEADLSGWKVSIHVEQQNPARHLYQRLGFSPAGITGIYLRMERDCSALSISG